MLLTWFALACGGDSAPTSPESTALMVEVDPTVPLWTQPPDKTAEAQAIGAWDNFHAQDSLNQAQDLTTGPPRMLLRAQVAKYNADFVQAILSEGRLNFWAITELYRQGKLTRSMEAATLAELERRIAARPEEHLLKTNAVVGLVHVGFDDSARTLAERWKDEPWFQKSWDANFYMGSLLFRYREHAAAVPYLEAALALHPDVETRLWLASALAGTEDAAALAKAKELFAFGAHLGADEGAHPFVDVADRMGIRRWQLAGANAWFDMDGDTFVDLVANGAYSHPELYRNVPGEGLVRTADPALDDIYNTPPGMVAADFDNDGLRDLYLTQAAWFSAGPNRLLRNVGGTHFEDRSEGDVTLSHINSCGAAALDFDRDGLVDLAVTGTMGGTLRLLKNKGDFVFEDVSEAAGLDMELRATSVGLAVGDVNDDGWPDIFVNTFTAPHGGVPGSGFTAPNQLYINQGDGHFIEDGAARGVAEGTQMGFGSWMFDHDGDGDLDILASNFAVPEETVVKGLMAPVPHGEAYLPAALYKNDGTGHFTNVADKAGFLPTSTMGAGFVDFDLDGDLDVILGPGSHPLLNMQPLLIYRNDGDDRFTLVTDLRDPDYFGKFHGMSFADHDRDGDPDMLINNGGVLLSDRFRDLFLENTTTGQNWLHLELVGTASNRAAIGAQVKVQVGDKLRMQEVAAGQGFSSTQSPALIFGLGAADQVDSVKIRWPSGAVQTLPALAAGQSLVVTEGSDKLRRIY
jgi:hypothetical protein